MLMNLVVPFIEEFCCNETNYRSNIDNFHVPFICIKERRGSVDQSDAIHLLYCQFINNNFENMKVFAILVSLIVLAVSLRRIGNSN